MHFYVYYWLDVDISLVDTQFYNWTASLMLTPLLVPHYLPRTHSFHRNP